MSRYQTRQGTCILGNSLDILTKLDDNSISLIITSPPFSNQRKKKYDSFDEIPQDQYVDWLLQFAKAAYSKLAPDGSLVIDIRSAYEKGKAVESIYFSGSNTTGKAAEDLKRKWISVEISEKYVASSVFRFCNDIETAKDYYNRIIAGENVVIQ